MPRIRYTIELEVIDLLLDQVFKGRHLMAPGEFTAAESFVRNAAHQHQRVFSRLQEKLPRKFASLVVREEAARATIIRGIELELEMALQQFGVWDRDRQWTEAFLRRVMAARDEALAR